MSAALTNCCTTATTAANTATTAYNNFYIPTHNHVSPPPPLSRYESQKRRDWNTFGQYLKNHRPPLNLSRCSGAHVLEFLRYLDQFGKTKVHTNNCPFFGHPHPPAPCPCPLKQAWGSLDALIGRLRAAFEEHGGSPETNPFGARAVRLYLREVRDSQAKARGIAYDKKKRKKPQPQKVSPNQEHENDHFSNNSNTNINTQDLFAQDQRFNVQVSEGFFESMGSDKHLASNPSLILHMFFRFLEKYIAWHFHGEGSRSSNESMKIDREDLFNQYKILRNAFVEKD
ncbi:hypothetical protein AgCh_025769 [Apium graveolens]